jgi:hypothetical protein
MFRPAGDFIYADENLVVVQLGEPADTTPERRGAGPRLIGEVLPEVLARYRLGEAVSLPLCPRLAEPTVACHAPNVSVS